MSVEKIISDWKNGKFKPFYWLEGEEEYYIDKAVEYAEQHILNETESAFNLSVFYGKDAGWPDVINACRRYPMFAERQVVIIKEAQQMKDIEKMEPYFENPLASTVLVVAYKDKKLDARKKFSKLVKDKGELLTTKKLYESQLPEWIQNLVKSKGFSLTAKGNSLLVAHIGNDLNRIEYEIDKIAEREGNGRGDVSRQGVQRDILPIVEGTTVMTKFGPVKTDHILFIAAGAFSMAKPSDLMPELQGRFPVRVNLKSLEKDDFIKILTEIENNLIIQYKELLKVDGVNLEITSEGIEKIAEYAIELNEKVENIGARRLATILEEVLREYMFEAPYEAGNGIKKIKIAAKDVELKMGKKIKKENLNNYIL